MGGVGLTFPCVTCRGEGFLVLKEPKCLHMNGNCPCADWEVPCPDCFEGSAPCGMCGERAATQEARFGGIACWECAAEEDASTTTEESTRA